MTRSALRRGLAACGLAAALTLGAGGWAGRLAAAPAEGFEAARLSDGEVRTAAARFAPLAQGEAAPGVPAGGRLVLSRDPLPGVSGAAVSTRDLAWPYAFVIKLARPAAALALVWAGANADWRVSARAADGAPLGQALVPGFDPDRAPLSGGAGDPQARLTLSLAPEALAASGGVSRLKLTSLGGWDWLLMDDLRVVESVQPPPPALSLSAPLPSPVPLPAAWPLLTAALSAFAALRRRR